MHPATLPLLLSLSLSGCSATSATVTPLDALLNTIERRLALAYGVALLKWDQNMAVEAPAREQQILDRVSEAAADHQLPPTRATGFFVDQIEASKLVQYALLHRWEVDQQAPDTPRLDLKTVLRPQLDALQHQLLADLSLFDQKRPIDCAHTLATALAARGGDPLHELGMQRATGGLCELP